MDDATPAFPDPIPGILPFGTVSIFSAASGAGKTSMLADWCARFQSGRPIWGHATHAPTALCYIAADRAWRADHALWFAAAGCDPIRHYSLADDPDVPQRALRTDGAASLLEYVLAALLPPPGALVFLDPLTPLFVGGSPNDQRPVALTLLRMGRICQERQLTMLCTAYFAKQKAEGNKDRYVRPVDRIAGTGVFAGYSHTQMYLVESDDLMEQPYHTFGWKPRHAKEEEFQVVRGADGLFIPYEGLVEDGADAEHDRPTQLLRLVPEDGIETSDLATIAIETFQYSRATFFRELDILFNRKLLKRDRRGYLVRRKPS